MKIEKLILFIIIIFIGPQIIGCGITGKIISGRVIDEQSQEGVKDVEIEVLYIKGNKMFLRKTDEKGKFTIEGLKEGKYKLGFSKKYIAKRKEEEVEIKEKKITLTVPITLTSMIEGRVIEYQTKKPIELAAVKLIGQGTQTSISGEWTKADGKFLFAFIEPGKYRLKVEHPVYIQVETEQEPLVFLRGMMYPMAKPIMLREIPEGRNEIPGTGEYEVIIIKNEDLGILEIR